MPLIAKMPKPPYYAVIFTIVRTEIDDGYADMAPRMLDLAKKQPGFVGVESVREKLGIIASYWTDLDTIKKWRQHVAHREAQRKVWLEEVLQTVSDCFPRSE